MLYYTFYTLFLFQVNNWFCLRELRFSPNTELLKFLLIFLIYLLLQIILLYNHLLESWFHFSKRKMDFLPPIPFFYHILHFSHTYSPNLNNSSYSSPDNDSISILNIIYHALTWSTPVNDVKRLPTASLHNL